MNPHTNSPNAAAPLDLSRWRLLPTWLIVIGGVGAVAGFFHDQTQFAFSWLLAFMFFLSLCLGGLCLVILHHLFDAGWSVPIRRVCEQLSCLLFPWMALLFIPIAFLAPKLYEWMQKISNHAADHPITAKYPLFTIPGFYIVAAICFLVWWWVSHGLRSWSLKQDETGSVECTRKMRKFAAGGVFLFAFTLTLAAIMWMKALQHEWFSTMYGVYYFAGSMWTTLATVYVITRILERQGPLQGLVHEKTYYFIGSMLFAFTVFYAYVTFAQYFIIWNANMPEETFWYVLREKGTWWNIGMVIIFGHFFVPFLMLLRIDWKLKLTVMVPLFVWAWLMHFVDMSFNIIPVLHPDNFHLDWLDLACMAFIGGLLTKIFLKQLHSHPIVPQKDPRFAESQEIYYVPPDPIAGAAAKDGGGH
jgi:hypothetical protein